MFIYLFELIKKKAELQGNDDNEDKKPCPLYLCVRVER